MTRTPQSDASKHLESFWDYREFFKDRMRQTRPLQSAESEADYRGQPPITPITEKLIQSIWANQLIQPEGLKLADGRPLRVMDGGRWNGTAGPDFRDAKLMIGERILTGDIEVHLDASEWRAHRHEEDMEYNRAVLHVVYRIDDGKTSDRLHNGEALPRLEIEPYLFPDMDTIRRSMSPDDYPYERPGSLGKCHEMMTDAPAEIAADFLDQAGDERFVAKVRRLEDQARGGDPEQAFYQAMMMSLGSGSGKALYYLLAKRTPPLEMFEEAAAFDPARRRSVFEAILLHTAGLIPSEEDWAESKSPAEALAVSRGYAAQLAALWERLEPYWSDRRIAPTRRWYRSIRPVNFPCRRLAAVAEILARSQRTGAPPLGDLARRVRSWLPQLMEARPARKLHPALNELVIWFEIDAPHDFWAMRYSFTAKPSQRPMALLGDSTARSLVFNAALPALALLAGRDGDEELAAGVRRLYAIFPPLQENHITEFMARRLFGDGPRSKDLITTERRRQALFQIFYSCCNGEEHHCDACYYFKE